MDPKVTETLWRAGRLRWLLKRQPAMFEAYDKFRSPRARQTYGRLWYWNISRQFGKSYSMCVLAVEEALSGPGRQVKYAAQDQKASRAIVFQQMEKILQDCPEDMLPKFQQQDGIYYFPHNGSRITVAGGDNDNMGRLRGQTANLCIVDEGAHIQGSLQRLLKSVLIPQTTTTGGRVLVATTPAESAGHYSTELAYRCKAKGAYAEFSIDANRLLSEEEKRELEEEYGGRDSTEFQREYLCQFVTDTRNAVVPEFSQSAESEIVRPVRRPLHFDTLVSLDGGFTDPAGCLFAHVDYARAKLVIESEWLKKECLTADIAKAVGERETALWGDSDHFWTDTQRKRAMCRSASRRVMDIDPEKAADFKVNHGMDWTPAQKGPGSLQVSVNALNSYIRQRSIEIAPECVNLIRQLHNATWAGRKTEDGMTPRRTFSRNHQDGHFDLVAALIYMLPFVDFSHNPAPQARQEQTMHYDAAAESDNDDTDEALANSFRNGY